MRAVDRNVIMRFAEVFCYGRRGFALEEIPQFFAHYQGSTPSTHSYEGSVTKATVFEDSIKALSPSNQRMALYDLCDAPPRTRHPLPSEAERKELLGLLVQADGRSPLAVEISTVTVSGVRSQWLTAASRIPSSPAGAITAARALVETTCKTIATELGAVPDQSGDLMRLYNQARSLLGLQPRAGASQNLHKILNGFTQAVDGIAGLSNQAGDRHGLEAGAKLSDLSFASAAVHAAGTVALFLVRAYKESSRGPRT